MVTLNNFGCLRNIDDLRFLLMAKASGFPHLALYSLTKHDK